MEHDYQDELDRHVEHLRQLPRATPPPALLERIEARLATTSARVVSLGEWRRLVAAAVLVGVLNVMGLLYYVNRPAPTGATEAEYALVSDYQLYE